MDELTFENATMTHVILVWDLVHLSGCFGSYFENERVEDLGLDHLNIVTCFQ